MPLTSNILMDRNKLKRGLLIWKLIAIFAVLILGLCAFNKRVPILVNQAEYIARVNLEGIIMEDGNHEKTLRDLANNTRVKAVMLHINSPGGTEVGSEIIYSVLREVTAHKPVVAIMGTMAASGGYMVACATDYILARHGTITGSIGIILQAFEVTELAAKLGIKPYTFKSSPLKGTPSPFERINDQVQEEIDVIIKDNYNYFVSLIAERRKLPKEQVLALADGRIFTGNQAVQNKLIDAIGGEKEALVWLKDVKKIKTDIIPVHDVSLEKKEGILQSITNSLSNLFPGVMDLKNRIQYGLLAL